MQHIRGARHIIIICALFSLPDRVVDTVCVRLEDAIWGGLRWRQVQAENGAGSLIILDVLAMIVRGLKSRRSVSRLLFAAVHGSHPVCVFMSPCLFNYLLFFVFSCFDYAVPTLWRVVSRRWLRREGATTVRSV